MKLMHSNNSGCVSVLLMVCILLFTISNYLTFRKLENRLLNTALEISTSPPSNVPNDHQVSVIRQLRQKALLTAESDRATLLNASKGSDNKAFYESVKPEAYCPLKLRIGESGDGGKYVCNPKAVKRDCTLLSLGLHNQIGYDQHIYNVTGRHCKILGADLDRQNEKTRNAYAEMGGQLFVGKIPTNLTIPEMLQTAGRDEVELLKIDIEEGEFTALEPLIKQYYVCQIFVEIHGTPEQHLQLLKVMARYGFRIFNVDPNPFCKRCSEYSLINEMCMHQFDVIPLAITIPH